MSERVSFWQVWRLRLRAAGGWGQNVPTLRRNGRSQAWTALRILTLPAIGAVLVYAPPPLGGGRPPRTLPATLHLWALPMALFLALMAVSIVWSRIYLARANAGEHQLPTTLDGECFAMKLERPRRLFALIGPSREQAQWFCLTLDWDSAIEPGHDRYTLTYTPATGFVERLERAGAEPITLTRSPGVSGVVMTSAAGATRPTQAGVRRGNGAATPEQRAVLRRDMRGRGSTWSLSNRYLSTGGWLTIVTGCVYGLSLIPTVSLLTSPKQLTPSNAHALRIVVSICIACCIICFVIGGIFLREWARRRRIKLAAAYTTIEGEQICWAPASLWSAMAGATLAQVRLDSGETLTFGAPPLMLYRVRRANGRVRVTYNPETWLVLDYRPLATPASA